MSGKLENSQILGQNLLEPLIANAKEALPIVLKLKEAMVELATEARDSLSGNELKTPDDFKKQAEDINAINVAVKEHANLTKKEIRLKAKLAQADSKQAKNTERLKQILREKNKEIKLSVQLERAEAGSINELRLMTTKMIQELEKLEDIQGKNAEKYKILTGAIKSNQDRLDAHRQSIGKSGKLQGIFDKSLERSGQSLKRFGIRVVAAGAAIVGFNSVLGKINEAVDAAEAFESTFTDVLNLLSQDEVTTFRTLLEEGSIKVVKDYGLAVEDVNKALFDAISAGVPAAEAIEFLNSSAELAVAGNTELAVAVDGTTSIMNAYHLEVSEATAIQDAFFAAQVEGKTTVAALSQEIGKVAPIAAKTGVRFQELLAAGAALTKGGLSTADSFTVLKGLLNSLIKPTDTAVETIERLNKELGTQIPSSISELKKVGLGKALEGITIASRQAEDSLAKILPNVRALTAGLALSGEGLKDYDEIVQKVDEDTGEYSSRLQGLARAQATEAQRTKRLKGETDALAITLGQKIAPILNDLRQAFLDLAAFISRNSKAFKILGKIILTAGIAFASFRLTAKLFNKENGILIKLLRKGALAFGTFTRAGNTAKVSINGLTNAIGRNPIGFFITTLSTAVVALELFATGQDEAAAAAERLNNQIQKTIDFNAQQAQSLEDLNDTQIDQLRREINERKAAGEDAIQLEQDLLKRREELKQNEVRFTSSTLTEIEQRTAGSLKLVELLEIQRDRRVEEIRIAAANRSSKINTTRENEEILFMGGRIQLAQEAADEQVKIEARVAANLRVRLSEQNEQLKDIQSEFRVNELEASREAGEALTDQQVKEGEKRQKKLTALRIRLENLQDAAIEDIEERRIQQITRKFNREIAAIKGQSAVERALRIQLELSKQTAISKIITEFRISRFKESLIFAKREAKAITQIQENQLAQDFVIISRRIEEQREELARAVENADKQAASASNRRLSELLDQQAELRRNQIQDDLEFRLSQSEVAADQIAEIERQITDGVIDQELGRRRIKEIERTVLTNAEIEALREKRNLAILKLEFELQDDISNNADAEVEAHRAADRLIVDSAKERNQEILESGRELAEQTAAFLKQQSEAREKVLDQQIEASEQRIDELRQNAADRRLENTESLADEQKRLRDLQAEKAEEERKRQRIDAALAAFNLLSEKIDAGDPQPVVSTIADISQLVAFLGAIPGFAEGTEYVKRMPGEKKGTDTLLRKLDEGERVIDKDVNKAFGDASNRDIAEGFSMYKAFEAHDFYQPSETKYWISPKENNEQMIAAIEKNTQAVRDIPGTSIELDELEKVFKEINRSQNKVNSRAKKLTIY